MEDSWHAHLLQCHCDAIDRSIKEIVAIKPIHSVAENVIDRGYFPTKHFDACWVVCSHTIGTKTEFLGYPNPVLCGDNKCIAYMQCLSLHHDLQ